MNEIQMLEVLDPYSLFAYKIVERAVYDWRLLMQGSSVGGKVSMEEIRQFLKSQWCAELLDGTCVTGEWVLKMLEDELKRLGPADTMMPTERKMQNKKAVTVDGVTASIYSWCKKLKMDDQAVYRMYRDKGREYCEKYLTGVKRRRGNA